MQGLCSRCEYISKTKRNWVRTAQNLRKRTYFATERWLKSLLQHVFLYELIRRIWSWCAEEIKLYQVTYFHLCRGANKICKDIDSQKSVIACITLKDCKMLLEGLVSTTIKQIHSNQAEEYIPRVSRLSKEWIKQTFSYCYTEVWLAFEKNMGAVFDKISAKTFTLGFEGRYWTHLILSTSYHSKVTSTEENNCRTVSKGLSFRRLDTNLANILAVEMRGLHIDRNCARKFEKRAKCICFRVLKSVRLLVKCKYTNVIEWKQVIFNYFKFLKRINMLRLINSKRAL